MMVMDCRRKGDAYIRSLEKVCKEDRRHVVEGGKEPHYVLISAESRDDPQGLEMRQGRGGRRD